MRCIFTIAGFVISLHCYAAEKVTYDDHVFPIFQQSCMNCHNPDKTKGGLDLSTYSTAMKGGSGGKIAEPGDGSSKIINLLHQTADPKMPPEGDPLPSAQIQIIKSWIEDGLLENKKSSARKPSKPQFNTALRSDPAAKPSGPLPMPEHLLLEPCIVTPRGTAVRAIAASPWSPLIAVTSQKQILLFHTETLELTGIIPFPEGEPVSLQFTPDARYLIIGGGIAGKSGLTVTYDITNGKRLLTAGKEFDSILAADIRPDFSIVATGSPSRMVRLWNTQTGAMIRSIKKHTDWVTALDISPDGILLATGDRNGGIYVWEAENGGEFHTLRAHQAAITQLTYRADSNILASSSNDGTIRFWEMNGGSEIRKLDAHSGGVTAFAWARDGSSLSVGRDHKIKVWKSDFGLLKELPAAAPLPISCCLDADGKKAFIGCDNGDILIYQIQEGKLISTITNAPPAIAQRIATIQNLLAQKNGDPATLTKQLQHWQAADINTKAIHTKEEALKHDEDFTNQCDEINNAYQDLTKIYQLKVDTKKRIQTIAQQIKKRSGDELLETELSAMLRFEQNKLSKIKSNISLAEQTYSKCKKTVEQNSPNRIQMHQKSKELQTRYQNQLLGKS